MDWTNYAFLSEDSLRDPKLNQVAEAMLSHGASLNGRDALGRTPLMMASMDGLTDRMALLLKHHAAIDCQDDNGCTALHFAVIFTVINNDLKYIEPVKMLLKYHASPNLRTKDGIRLLSLASDESKPSPEIIRLLKAAGATN